MKKRIAILISGRGSNMRALVEAAKAADYPGEAALVFANSAGAAGLAYAADNGIAAEAFSHKAYPSREAFDQAVDDLLRARNIDIICLAGFMRIFSRGFVEAWRGRILNIHPSLLPSFPGLHPQRQSLEAGVAISGCTVHFVTPDLDAGPIVGQAAVPVLPGDTEETLSARILAAEHKLYAPCLRLVCEGSVRLEGARAVFAPGAQPPALF